jgi:hypothetical protein
VNNPLICKDFYPLPPIGMDSMGIAYVELSPAPFFGGFA